jgi:hypothetical protein
MTELPPTAVQSVITNVLAVRSSRKAVNGRRRSDSDRQDQFPFALVRGVPPGRTGRKGRHLPGPLQLETTYPLAAERDSIPDD